MKKFFLILFFLALSVSLFVPCSASEDRRYIVCPKSSEFLLFNADSSSMPFFTADEDTLKSLLSRDLVEWYEEDYEVSLLDADSSYEPLFSSQWNLTLSDVPSAWELGCYGDGITVGVLDSGIVEHEDLQNNILGGYNYLDRSFDVTDRIGHGTFVTGLIAAEQNGVGITGAAPKARIIPLKCFDSGVKTTVSILCAAIYDAADLYDCDILNMSFGLKNRSAALESALLHAAEKGCVLVAAVGNDGSSELYYPAAFEEVIGVGAVDNSAVIASFSQQNESVSVVAGGKTVLGTDKNGGYSTGNGTSFSAPLVSGIIADLLSADKEIPPEEIKSLLQNTADDLGKEGRDSVYGYGLVQTGACLKALLKNKAFFLSPPLCGKEMQYRFFNNTDQPFFGCLILLSYDTNRLLCDVSFVSFHASAGEIAFLTFPYRTESTRAFVLESLSNLKPCGKERRRDNGG